MRTSELDMADSVHPDDIDTFIDNAAWAICSTYHAVLKASPGAAIWTRHALRHSVHSWLETNWRIGYRQSQTDCINTHENNKQVDYDYKVGDKILIRKDNTPQSRVHLKKRTMDLTTVHTHGTISIQYGTKLERINIRRVTPFSEELLIKLGIK